MLDLKNLFYLLKIRHWIKNLSIFLPIFVAQAFNKNFLNEYIIHFLIFSIASSVVYLVNNTYDYEKDIINKKLNYQIDISKKKLLYIIGFFIALFLIFFVSYYQKNLIIIICCYLILSLIYNLLIKNIKYIDIFFLATFHFLRIYYGSIAFNIEISIYFLSFCLSVFFMVG